MGEEFNKLMFEGCFVFHDIPSDAKWNIHHVAVAPTGVVGNVAPATRFRPPPPYPPERHSASLAV